MNITFLSFNCSYSHTTLAGAYFRAYTDLQGAHTWRTVELTTKEKMEYILQELLSEEIDLLLASCYIFNRIELEQVLGRFRRLRPNVTVILGGPEFLGDNEAIVADQRLTDIVIRGEGEIPMKALLDQSLDPEGIAGLCYLNRTGEYCDTGMADDIQDLDEIPSPFLHNFMNLKKPFIQIETTRGCPNKCAFCTSSIGDGVRSFSLERVRADLRVIRQNKITEIRLLDRTFNCNIDRAVKLIEMFRDEFPDMHFHAEFDPAFMPDRLVDALRLAPVGQLHLEAGLQTFSDVSYEKVGRLAPVNKTAEGLAKLCDLENIEVHADLIAGLPGGGIHDLYRDISTMIELGPTEIQLENLKLLPGTPLEKNAEADGLIAAQLPPYEVLQTDIYSFAELALCQQWSRMIDWFYNLIPLQKCFRQFVLAEPENFRLFHAFLDKRDLLRNPMGPENRLKLFHQFLSQHPDQDIMDLLAESWFISGYSPEHGPFPGKRWIEEIPAKASLSYGSANKIEYWKVYCYEESHRTLYIAYNKGQLKSRNREISIWSVYK